MMMRGEEDAGYDSNHFDEERERVVPVSSFSFTGSCQQFSFSHSCFLLEYCLVMTKNRAPM